MSRNAGLLQAERDVIRACHAGLDSTGVRREVLRSLRRLIPVDAAFFATADPETLLFTGVSTEEPLDSVTHLFLDNEYGGDDVNKFATLATARHHVASLDGATRHVRGSSSRYRDIMGPLGLGDELRAALVVGTQCWGFLCLHREDREHGFSAAEATTLGRLGPHIAHALRQGVLVQPSGRAPDLLAPGVVLIAEDMTTVAITPEAEQLLEQIRHDHTPQLPLPAVVYSVAAALRATELGAATLPSARVRAVGGGWINVHASRLRGPGEEEHIAIVVEPIESRATVPLLLAAHGLSPREAEVARLVLRGQSTRIISNALHISEHTVQDHMKAVFDKVGVRSRRDLVGLLLGAPER